MDRTYGPYRTSRGNWSVVIRSGVGRDAPRKSFNFASEAKALEFAAISRKEAAVKPVTSALEEYLEAKRVRGDRPATIKTAWYLIGGLLGPVKTLPVDKVSPARAVQLYGAYQDGRAVASHQGALKHVKAFYAWCVKNKLVRENPFTSVEPTGRRRRGKKQLRIDEASKLYQWATARALECDDALAVLMGLVLGMRASEIIGVTARDLDDRGRVLWIERQGPGGTEVKTQAGVRPLSLPPELSVPLTRRAERTSGRLLPYRRWWVRDAVKRACIAAGVPVVCAHSLRGSSATAALEAGVAASAVAQALGHSGTKVLHESYAARRSGDSARVMRVTEKLSGAGERTPVMFSSDATESDLPTTTAEFLN